VELWKERLMSTHRRLAILGGLLLIYAVVVSPIGTTPVYADRLPCIQDINADAAACNDNCNYLYAPDSDDLHACLDSCYLDWDWAMKNTGAVWCSYCSGTVTYCATVPNYDWAPYFPHLTCLQEYC
jgi:hypothetical protein